MHSGSTDRDRAINSEAGGLDSPARGLHPATRFVCQSQFVGIPSTDWRVRPALGRSRPWARDPSSGPSQNPLPHLPTNTLHFTAPRRPGDGLGPTPEATRLQDELIGELAGAARIVIGAPMYNFSMPSTLKAWLDYVHVIGSTSPSEEGIAPLRSKPVTVVSSRATPTGADPRADFVLGQLFTILGGFMSMDVQGFVVHTEPPAAPGDFHRPYELVRAELLAHADEANSPTG
jgi:FMN-dependent NADH-azoreductase